MPSAIKNRANTHRKKSDERQAERNIVQRQQIAARKAPIDRKRNRVS
jgi:hypothetical protein